MQLSGPRRAFKRLDVAKWYCKRDSIGDTFPRGVVGRALTPIAARMSQGEVMLVVWALLGQRDDMVNVELILVEYGIDGVVTNEAFSGLPVEQSPFKRRAAI